MSVHISGIFCESDLTVLDIPRLAHSIQFRGLIHESTLYRIVVFNEKTDIDGRAI